MRINSMKRFMELAKAGSFYQAAQRSTFSVQGYAKALDSLEAELGVKLAERSRQGLSLTRQGEAFYQHAETIVAQYHAMLDDVFSEPESQEGDSRALVTLYESHLCLIDGANFTQDDRTKDDLLCVETSLEEALPSILHQQPAHIFCFDLNAAEEQELGKIKAIVQEPVHPLQAGIVVSVDSPLRELSAIYLADLMDAPLAYDPHPNMAFSLDKLYPSGRPHNLKVATSNMPLLFQFARQNPNHALLFDSFRYYLVSKRENGLMEGVVFLPLADAIAKGRVCRLYLKSVKHPIQVRQMIDRHLGVVDEMYADYCEMFPQLDFPRHQKRQSP